MYNNLRYGGNAEADKRLHKQTRLHSNFKILKIMWKKIKNYQGENMTSMQSILT